MFKILLLVCLWLPFVPVQASTLLVLGDSISAGYGLANVNQGWVALIGTALAKKQHQIINAGISGDTSAGGLNRLPRLIEKHSPDIVIIELGGNDGLRGISVTEMDKNLRAIVLTCRKAGAIPVLLGMQMPPNYGKQFANRFEATYSRIADDLSVVFVDGFLRGVGDVPELMQPDAIHPNASAQILLEERVLKAVNPLLDLKPSAPPQNKVRR